MLSSELPVLHLSKDSDTFLCGYTQPTVGLARPVSCITLTPCYMEGGVTATNACTPDRSGPETRQLQAKALCYHCIKASRITGPTQTLQRRLGLQPKPCLQILKACGLDVICNGLKLRPGIIALHTGILHHSAAVPQPHYCSLHLW